MSATVTASGACWMDVRNDSWTRRRASAARIFKWSASPLVGAAMRKIRVAGVDFGAPDGPATLIFLIAAPTSGDADHLKILAALARRLVHESFRTSIQQAPDASTVADIVTREVVPS